LAPEDDLSDPFDPADPAELEHRLERSADEAVAALTEFPLVVMECNGRPNDSQSSYTDGTSPGAVYSSPW
jgi:hypothetical protein